MMRVERLHKRFGAMVAVADVSFVAADGEVTGVLGPNGAGKTTTLRMMTGVFAPTSGSVHIDGVNPVAAPTAARQRLGVLPDGAGLYGRLTVREHLEYAARLAGLGRAAMRDAVARTIETFGLEPLATRATRGFSQGEQRLVALARAMVHDPQNVLLDEPTGALDVLASRRMRALVRQLAARGRGVIITTHIMSEAEALCDRIVVITKGRTVADGTSSELCRRTATHTLEAAFVTLVGEESLA